MLQFRWQELPEPAISVFISGLFFKTSFSGLEKGKNRVPGFFRVWKSIGKYRVNHQLMLLFFNHCISKPFSELLK